MNFPDVLPEDVREVEVTTQGRRDQHIIYADKRTDPRGGAYFWLGFRGKLSNPPDGTDLRAIYEGRISVTPLHIDLTHMESVHDLKAVLGGRAERWRVVSSQWRMAVSDAASATLLATRPSPFAHGRSP